MNFAHVSPAIPSTMKTCEIRIVTPADTRDIERDSSNYFIQTMFRQHRAALALQDHMSSITL